MRQISSSIFKQLRLPKRSSHKGQNGRLYIVAGSKQYHGALLYAIQAAEHFVDLIYVETDPSNHGAVRSLKSLHPAIILVSPKQRSTYLKQSDCLLLGPGLGKSPTTKRLVQVLLTSVQRPNCTVIDADALAYMQPKWAGAATILTPHPGELKPWFQSSQFSGVLVQKGLRTVICQAKNCEYNTRGIAQMTKGGVGDILAGLTAGFACTNPPYLAARAASLLLGETVRQLQQVVGPHLSTRFIPQQLPLTLWRYQRPHERTRQPKA